MDYMGLCEETVYNAGWFYRSRDKGGGRGVLCELELLSVSDVHQLASCG
jgi:hypothetical protein